MMRVIFQIIFALSIVVGVIYFLTHNNSRAEAYKKILAILFLIAGILAIVFPGLSDDVAGFFGIESGQALILYLTIALVLYLFLRTSTDRRLHRQDIAKLVRKIAILEQQLKNDEEQKNKKGNAKKP